MGSHTAVGGFANERRLSRLPILKADGLLPAPKQTRTLWWFASSPPPRYGHKAAIEVGGLLIVGNMLDLLSATEPDQVKFALRDAMTQGTPIVDAVTEAEIRPDDIARLHRHGTLAAQARRAPIKQGLERSLKRLQQTPENQIKAAKGSATKANRYAKRIRPTVEEIRLELGAGSELGPTAFARALNSRGVVTTRGTAWSAETARALLLRLEHLDQDEGRGAV